MVIFTPKDYWKYIQRFPMLLVVHEDEEEYRMDPAAGADGGRPQRLRKDHRKGHRGPVHRRRRI